MTRRTGASFIEAPVVIFDDMIGGYRVVVAGVDRRRSGWKLVPTVNFHRPSVVEFMPLDLALNDLNLTSQNPTMYDSLCPDN